MEWKVTKGQPYPYGVTVYKDHVNIAFELPRKKTERYAGLRRSDVKEKEWMLTIYDLDTGTIENYEIDHEWRYGDAVGVSAEHLKSGKKSWSRFGYRIFQGTEPIDFSYATSVLKFGKTKVYGFEDEPFEWGDDPRLNIPMEELYIYKLHVRGFTKQTGSEVKAPGTFEGVREKIPYLKELGINGVELMPVYAARPLEERDHRVNYWGYGPADFMAVKPEYSELPGEASVCLKKMIKAFHQAGIEVYLEIPFDRPGHTEEKLVCLRHWAMNYHVDGFHLNAATSPMADILSDGILSDLKMMSEHFDGSKDRNPAKRRGIYHNGFQEQMRRFLRGDEGSASGFMNGILNRSKDQGHIQYMTNHNGFTLMDLVSYDHRHNEANGEENRDGMDWNLSWNCGEEGPSRRKEVNRLRRQQLKNGWVLNILQQGTPLIYQGDEFGNSQRGNNNAWCQDNRISWLDWKLLEKNQWLFNFAKQLIELRKREELLHPKTPFHLTDMKGCGLPDFSFHGKAPWFFGDSDQNRCVGCLYAGENKAWYAAYNMSSAKEIFALPVLPKKGRWKVYLDTAEWNEGGVEVSENEILLLDRSIVLLEGNYESRQGGEKNAVS